MECLTNAPWVALHVRAKTEQTVAQHLQYRKYEHFLPLRDGAPLFDGYVFCRFDAAAAAPLVTTPGVIRIVSFGAVPARVDEHEIAAIRQALASGQTVVPLTTFLPGEMVSIAEGPLRGLSGTVLRVADKQFLVVSITLLQRSIAVEVHQSWVRPEQAGHLPRYAVAPHARPAFSDVRRARRN